MADTICAIATGSGVSAIGIVRMSGPESITLASKLFSPMPNITRKLAYGELRNTSGELLDLCMCTVSYAPNSYTGENTVEFQCHGSPVVLSEIVSELCTLGARLAKAGEFTKRAFINGKLELTSAEAVADIIDAESIESVKNAASQLNGKIDTEINEIYSNLLDISSHYYAVLDYPDEDIEDFQISNYKNILNKSIDTVKRLLSTVDSGKILKSGIPTVIVGKPNAGKSSLLNALVGYDRAIVTSVPGTTRDTIEEKIKIGKVILRLIDTAGIRDTGDEIEKIGVERSLNAIENAKLVINVIDGTASDKPLNESYLAVYNKCDLPGFRGGDINISAKSGQGIDKLKETIDNMFEKSSIPYGEVITNPRQEEALKNALIYLDNSLKGISEGYTPDIILTEIEGALRYLGELNGRTVTEDVTNRIFARFCVGK